jgi:hypothetical protein
VSDAAGEEEVVCQGDTMAGFDFVDFVLAVTVECCPLDFGRCSLVFGGPVEGDILTRGASVANGQLATLVW